MSEKIIELNGITKKYSINFGQRSLIGNIMAWISRKKLEQEILALNNINFFVEKGQTIGIIGENASGKTTLLRIISGITFPTQGEIRVQGKVAGLLELSAGFQPELTGRENIYLNAALFGMQRREIEQVYKSMVEFSGLGDFINAQIKTYSQGMLVRLGFSIAVHTDPDIFLIDDSLAVGDEEFQRRCLGKVSELKAKGKTIIIVSHDLNSLSRICDRGLLLKNGKLIKDDVMHRVIVRYIEAVGNKGSVGCIDKGRLSLIFNSGRLILLWNGKPLTKNWGGYISFMVMGKWLPSWQAEWLLVESSPEHFKFEGILHSCSVKIILEILAKDESAFTWRINAEIPRAAGVKKMVMGFMLCEDYDHFLNETELELIKKQDTLSERWQDLYITDEDNALLTLSAKEEMPAIAARFNKDDYYRGVHLIQKTDKELEALVLQLQIALPNKQEEKDLYSIGCESHIQLLEKEDLRKLLSVEQNRRNIHSGNLRISLSQKKFRIFYNKSELTKDKGLIFGFYYQGYYFNIFDGQWRIEQSYKDSISLSSDFKHLSLSFKVILECKESELSWQLNYKSQNGNKADCLLGQVFLKEEYDYYFDACKKKDFIAATDISENIPLENSDCGFIGVAGQKTMVHLPAVVLESKKETQIQLENASAGLKARVLGLSAKNNRTMQGKLKFIETKKQVEDFVVQRKQGWEKETVLNNGKLRLIPNSNQIRIYYDDFEVTAEEGLSSSVFFKDRWHSIARDFKVIDKNDNKMVIKTQLKILPIEEYWHLELNNECINWTVFFNILEPVQDFDYAAGILLRSHFTQWINSYEKGYFGIDRITVSKSSLVGAKTNSADQPAVLFKSIDTRENSKPTIEDIAGKRSLKFKLGLNQGTINAVREKKVFTGKIMILNEKSLKKEINDYCLQNFSLDIEKDKKLFVVPKSVQLIFKDKVVTKDEGFKVHVLGNDGRNIESSNATWYIRKNGSDKIEAELIFKNLPLIQRWNFEAKENIFMWTIMFKIKQKLIIKGMTIEIQLASFFNYWFTEMQKGIMKNLKQDNLRALTVVDNRSNFIELGIDEGSLARSILILNPLLNMQDWYLHLIRYKEKKDMLSCAVHRIIDPENGLVLDEGEHEIFKAKLILGENRKNLFSAISIGSKLDKVYKLAKNHLELKFDRAKCRIYWKKQELTKSLCLYSGFCIAGNWFVSPAAHWQIESKADSADIALFWNNFLVFQKWHIALKDDNKISWQVEMDIKQADVNTVMVALMISDQFDCWQSESGVKNKFPERFHEIYHADQFSSHKENIGVFSSKKKLPSLLFESLNKSHNYTNFIENSDILHQSRVLKCEAKNFLFESNELKPTTFNMRLSLKD